MSSGALPRLALLCRGPVIAAIYPVATLLVQLLLSILAGMLVASLLGAGNWALRLCIAVPVILLVLRWFKLKDNKLFAYYLMHDYAYFAQNRGRYPEELEQRIAKFADEIAIALAGDADEILIVGHSSGAQLGVSILADLVRQGRVPANGPELGLLTLGQVIPMVSFLPSADRLRADLHLLSQQDDITWVDVSAPGDGCAFALCDPVAVSGVAPDHQTGPLVLSAAFTQTLAPETWRALRWRFFRLHFQYLCAFDRPGDYDYFQITAGPKTLAERFAGRRPSASKIDRPASPHTSMAA